MALIRNKLAAATAVAAVLSTLAAPAAAVELPRPATAEAYDGGALDAERHRRRGRDNDIDTGDVIAGVLVLGAIAAIAGAGKRNRERERERYEQRYPVPDDDAGYQVPSYEGSYGSRGIDRAVDICVGEVERRADRVGSVDAATRSADGWHVSGALEGGAPYSCAIGDDGRISEVFIGENSQAYEGSEGQYGEEYYSSARAGEGYPGDDGRYDVAKTPDFEQ